MKRHPALLALPTVALMLAAACAAPAAPAPAATQAATQAAASTAKPSVAPATDAPAPTGTPYHVDIPEAMWGMWQANLTNTGVTTGLWTMEIIENEMIVKNPKAAPEEAFPLGVTDITADQVKFWDDPECPPAGVDAEATYTYTVEAGQLVFTEINEDCADRAELLTAAPWERSTAATQSSAPTATVRPTLQPSEDGRIAFAVRSADSSNIFSILPDGSDMQQLTTDAGNHLCASYSADASQIAYCGDGSGAFEIWTINADGSQPTQLTHLEGRALFPDASHDGSKIAFGGVVGDDPSTQIYVVDAATGEGLVALTSCEGMSQGCSNDYPSWSPDDQQIVYIHADDYVNDQAVNAQVWVMNADGSDPHQLTTDSLTKDQVPNWSPDGTSIVYEAGKIGDEGIWVMKSDGSDQHQLSGCVAGDESPCPEGDDFGPVWSPDGTRIAFLRSFQDVGTNDRPVYVMNADGSDQHRLTEDVILAAVPSWR